MNKNITIIIISVLTLVVLAGGFWYLRENKVAKNKEIGSVENIEEDFESNEIDTTNWLTYRNDEYKYAFDYPSDWILTEHYNNVAPEPNSRLRGFRYISFNTPDKVFNIEIGIKNQDESEWIFAHSWHTGIPAGDIYRGSKIKVLDNIAEKQILAFGAESYENNVKTKPFNSADPLEIRMVSYCKPSQESKLDWCYEFPVGKNKIAHAEIRCAKIDCQQSYSWENAQEQLEKVLASFRFID
jgi:hypothetical protein